MKVWKCIVNNGYFFFVYGENKKEAFRSASLKEVSDRKDDFYYDDIHIKIEEADSKEVYEWVQSGNEIQW